MGPTQSKTAINNFQKSLTSNITNEIVELATNIGAVSAVRQSITFSNIRAKGCKYRVENVSNNAAIQIDFEKVLQYTSEDEMKGLLANATENALKSNQEIATGFMSSLSTESSNSINNMSEAVQEVVKNMNYSDITSIFMNAKASQEQGFFNMSCEPVVTLNEEGKMIIVPGEIYINNISNNFVAEIVARDLSAMMTQGLIDMTTYSASSNDEEADSNVESTGPVEELGNAIGSIAEQLAEVYGDTVKIVLIVILVIGAIIVSIILGLTFGLFGGGSKKPELPQVDPAMMMMQMQNMGAPLSEAIPEYEESRSFAPSAEEEEYPTMLNEPPFGAESMGQQFGTFTELPSDTIV